MQIVKEGYPFIGVCALLTVILLFVSPAFAILTFVLMLYFAYFFRNPNRVVAKDDDILYSPADGKVMDIKDFYDNEYLNEDATKVTIFLSVVNVHVNRSPMAGEIKYQRYTCGQYLPAFKKAAPFENERHAVGIDNGKMRILVIQIAGILARRIVSWVTLGHKLEQGECYGMIKFGSSTELVVPRNVEIVCHKGDRVVGGVTILGRIKHEL